MKKTILFLLLLAPAAAFGQRPLPDMVKIPAGEFRMGSDRVRMEDQDEAPSRQVSVAAFQMSRTEITNAQYEAFDPSHRKFRGYKGFSYEDDEAVIMVSWHDAKAYCKWLSAKTGQPCRLPTEAEWEYACRAGTASAYNTGETFPEAQWKVQENTRDKKPVSLKVAMFPANQWGLYDMHGNVEEWCEDERDWQYRAVRGGSHNTPVHYLRSANRSASIPEDRSVLLGFRVVFADAAPEPAPAPMPSYDGRVRPWGKPVSKPIFMDPQPYIIEPGYANGFFYSHQHQPAVTWTRDGLLLAVWFSTDAEAGREMTVLQSTFDGQEWTPASVFCKVPDRNMTGTALLTLEDGSVLHFQGVGDAGEWKDLALAMRIRRSYRGSWSAFRYIAPEHGVRHQVIAGPVVSRRDGRILLCCDAGPDGEAGSALFVSRDGGHTWEDTGGTIAGIHAGLVERADGSLMAFGRGNAIDGKMPCSISHDGGRTWEVSATEFPAIGSGQRLVLRRLAEGPVMLCSFGPQGLFVALSYDEGASWPVQKLLTDGTRRELDGGAWTGPFVLDAAHAEPKGYLACTQSPDGMIHLLSSRVHYRFNLAWIEQK